MSLTGSKILKLQALFIVFAVSLKLLLETLHFIKQPIFFFLFFYVFFEHHKITARTRNFFRLHHERYLLVMFADGTWDIEFDDYFLKCNAGRHYGNKSQDIRCHQNSQTVQIPRHTTGFREYNALTELKRVYSRLFHACTRSKIYLVNFI